MTHSLQDCCDSLTSFESNAKHMVDITHSHFGSTAARIFASASSCSMTAVIRTNVTVTMFEPITIFTHYEIRMEYVKILFIIQHTWQSNRMPERCIERLLVCFFLHLFKSIDWFTRILVEPERHLCILYIMSMMRARHDHRSNGFNWMHSARRVEQGKHNEQNTMMKFMWKQSRAPTPTDTSFTGVSYSLSKGQNDIEMRIL